MSELVGCDVAADMGKANSTSRTNASAALPAQRNRRWVETFIESLDFWVPLRANDGSLACVIQRCSGERKPQSGLRPRGGLRLLGRRSREARSSVGEPLGRECAAANNLVIT